MMKFYIIIFIQQKDRFRMFFCSLCTKQEEGEIFINARQSLKAASKPPNKQQTSSSIGNQILIVSSNYDALVEKCMKTKKSFVDEQFMPNQTSLNYSEGSRTIEWKRISQLEPNCIMVSEYDVNVNSIKNNITKNTQFLTAVLCIAENPERIKNIFADNFIRSQYGIYKVIVNINGVPKEMVIDDYIPVFSPSNRPVFCKMSHREIWMVLLEKAYAKVKGSYGNISKNVYVEDIFETFLIGPCFNYCIQQKISEKFEKDLWMNLLQSCVFDAPICTGSNKEHISQIGLDTTHTYQIVNCIQIPYKQEIAKIVRIRNIWTQTTYKSKANINDYQFWSKVSQECKQIILPTSQYVNQFTIPYQDFLYYFSFLSICHLRRGFNYQFYELRCHKREPSFFSIQIKKQQQIYISLKMKLNNKNSKIKYIRAVLAGKKQQKYTYITSKIQTEWHNMTIKAQLAPGSYVVLLESDSNDTSDYFDVNFGFFNNCNRANHQIEPIKNLRKRDKQDYLVKVLMNESLKSNENKHLLNDKKSWLKYKTLFQEGGYAYIVYHKAQLSQYNIQIALDEKQIKENGFVLKCTNQSYRNDNQQDLIYIFSYNFDGEDPSDINFPPKGFTIKSIV